MALFLQQVVAFGQTGILVVNIQGPTTGSNGQTQSFTTSWTDAGSPVSAPSGDVTWSVTKGSLSNQTETTTDVTWSSTGSALLEYYMATWADYYYDTHSITVTGTPPAAPVAGDATSVTTNAFTATWSSVGGATSYNLDVSQSSVFSTVTTYSVSGATTKNLSGLSAGTTYYYRVRTVSANGESVTSSNTITTVTIPVAPAAPAASGKTATGFTVSWNSVSGAASYRLDVSGQSNFSDYVSSEYTGKVVSLTSQSVSGLTPAKTYYFRVRAVNSANGTSANSGNGSETTKILNYDQNFIRVVIPQDSGYRTVSQLEGAALSRKQVSYQFFDGLGRPVQTVGVQQSPGHNDVVQPIAYDGFGREAVKYLPYTAGSNGTYKTDFVSFDHEDYEESPQYSFYNNGSATIAQDNVPYAKTIFEASPLGRPDKDYGAGAAWHTNSKFIQHSYLVNQHGTGSSSTQEKVIAWEVNGSGVPVRVGVLTGYIETGGYYTTGQLTIKSTKDEQGNEVREYTNKSGQVVLKKVQAASGAGSNLNSTTAWASTYYVYDDLNNLRFVFQPELGKILHGSDTAAANTIRRTNWAFQYTYDSRKRMITKRVPGAGVVYMVYDNRDRLVLTQDANQRSGSNKYWTFTKYDALNRPVLTGIHTADSTLSQAKMQRRVNVFYAGSGILFETAGSTVHGYTNQSYPSESTANNYLTVTYYDTYAYKTTFTDSSAYSFTNHLAGQESSYFKRLAGQVTGTKVKVLDGGITGGGTWLKTVNYYDDDYRVIQTVTDNYKQGRDRITNVYDFTGRVLKTKSSHEESDVTWKDLTAGVVRVGERLYRNSGGSSDDHGAASAAMLPANTDGWFEFTHSNGNTLYIGLSATNTNASYTTIDYCLRVGGSSAYAAIRSGGTAVVPGTHVLGDVFRIERVSGTVRILKNGTVVHTFSGTSTSALLVDVSFNGGQASVLYARASFTSSAHDVIRYFSYDHAGRLLNVWHRLDAQDSVLLVRNEYNELGQLIDKKLHSTNNGAMFRQSIDHAYNIRGWLTKINESDLSVADDDAHRDLFGMQLGYNDDLGISNTGLYNGNISGIKWSNNQALGDVKQNAYTYSYDELNRIKTSVYKEKELAWSTPSNNGNQETGFTYDLNGNILTLQRNDRRTSGWMDNLSYSYGNGTAQSNRLLKVTDSGDATKGFIDVNSGSDDYIYDVNGNLSFDRNKGGTETLANGSFDSGNASWTLTNSGRLTFTSGEVQIASGAAQSILQQTVVTQGKPYVVVIDMERTSGTLEVYVGSTAATFNTTGVHTVTVTSGANSIFSILAPAGFVGKIKSISLKGVTVITYNFLNLPELVTRAGDKQLQYIYDATGRKLKQEVTKSGVLEKSTDYAGEYIYENDTLQFINHEEGRIVSLSGVEGAEYQYHLKDHLGNVRMTFTSKQQVDTYVATMESAHADDESAAFDPSYDNATIINSSLYNKTASGSKSQRLSAANANEIVGLAKSLAVMPGDTVNIKVYGKYYTPTNTSSNAATAMLTSITQAFGVSGASTGEALKVYNRLNSMFGSGFFLTSTDWEDEDAPKAFLNYILFDKDFVPYDMGWDQIDESALETGLNVAHDELTLMAPVTKPGYIYIYLSNENEKLVDVYFDDLTIQRKLSPVIQQNDYYSFGLNFNSYQRDNSMTNQYLYNGKETQDELDLGWLDHGARMFDPAIARWMVVDPLCEEYFEQGAYNFVANNPIIFLDEDGREIKPSEAFTASNYGKVHNYLMKNNNTTYSNMLSKFTSKTGKFNLTLDTNNKNIPRGAGGYTKYTYKPGTDKNGKKYSKSAESREDFDSNKSTGKLTAWHLYIVVHEGTHSTEALNPNIAELEPKRTPGIYSNDHEAFTGVITNTIGSLAELNADLKLGWSDDQITEVAMYGAENSEQVKNYMEFLSQKNGTTVEEERNAYRKRVQHLLSQDIEIKK